MTRKKTINTRRDSDIGGGGVFRGERYDKPAERLKQAFKSVRWLRSGTLCVSFAVSLSR